MPHGTQGYLFEYKVLGFAHDLMERLMGDAAHASFLLTLTEDGVVRSITFECPAASWGCAADASKEVGIPYLLFDPFEPNEYTNLAWHGIGQATMERLIGSTLEASDFERAPSATARVHQLDPPLSYPGSWGVVFG